MFGLGPVELSIILIITLVVFGGKKLRTLGGDLGGAISEFKSSMSEEDEEEGADAAAKTTEPENKEEE